jgi:cell division protein FtsN
MPRDYAKQKTPRERVTETSRAGWLWLLAGVLIGLFMAGLAFLNRHEGNLKQDKQATTSPIAKVVVKKLEKPKQAASPHFDFYTMLPKNQTPAADQADLDNPPSQASPATPPSEEIAAALPAIDEKPAVLADNPLPSANKPAENATPTATLKPMVAPAVYIIAIAAFTHYPEADQLKAQLSLLGFDANITPAKSKGLGIHRVWLGPYTARTTAEKELRRLKENRLTGILSKKHP